MLRLRTLLPAALLLAAPLLAQNAPDPGALGRRMTAPSASVRIAAITEARALGQGQEGHGLLPALGGALRDDYWDVRRAAVDALVPFGAEAVPVILPVLADSPVWCRNSACEALALIGPAAKAAVPQLIQAVQSPDVDLRVRAAWALSRIGADAAPAIPMLTAAIATDRSPALAYELLALERAGGITKALVPSLVSLLLDGVEEEGAARALAALGDAGVAPLVQALNDPKTSKPAAWKTINALGRIGAPAAAAVPALVKEQQQPRDQWFAALTAEALGNIGPKAAPATQALAGALAHASADVRRNAAVALGKIGPGAAAALPALETAAQDAEKGVSDAAKAAIAAIRQ